MNPSTVQGGTCKKVATPEAFFAVSDIVGFEMAQYADKL